MNMKRERARRELYTRPISYRKIITGDADGRGRNWNVIKNQKENRKKPTNREGMAKIVWKIGR
jgi:hypothetical protein